MRYIHIKNEPATTTTTLKINNKNENETISSLFFI